MKYNFPKAKILSEIVREHSLSTPDKIAINDGVTEYTFAELENKSNYIASQMKSDGINKGDRVCLLASKCSNLVLFAIAIWKVGAIYCPLDVDLPLERLEKIIRSMRPSAIVGLQSQSSLFDQVGVSKKYLLETVKDYNTIISRFEYCESVGEDDAIIVQTSGTTGLPKGVVLQHKSVIAYFNSHRFILGISNNSRCMNTSSFHYDVSIQDTFQPLYFGAYVFLYTKFFIPDIALPLIRDQKFTLITAVSTILDLITGSLKNLDDYNFCSLKCISTGAEVCSVQLLNKWLCSNPGLTIVNGYGPAEVNSVTISYTITAPDETRFTYYPIGKPHRGVEALLLSGSNEVISDAFQDGELLLGGEQLMHYYWNNEAATKDAFVELNGIRYYKTGDICFYDENCDLVYNGRKDFEVKHNGRRINLNEITAMIENEFSFHGVECHQIRLGDSSSFLNMIIKIQSYEKLAGIRESIFEYLKTKLPGHSIPTIFSFYNEEIKTSSGKTDRKRLFSLCQSAVSNGCSGTLVYREGKFVSWS